MNILIAHGRVYTSAPHTGPLPYSVYLDGVLQTHVVAVDDENGVIVRHVLNADGHSQTTPDRSQLWTETVSGKVEIILDERH